MEKSWNGKILQNENVSGFLIKTDKKMCQEILFLNLKYFKQATIFLYLLYQKPS